MTEPEKLVWKQLRDSQLGFKFRRQQPMGEYILDFYCPSLRLAVEVDGAVHHERTEYDTRRDAFIESLGIRVVRVWNMEVRDPFGDALEKISAVIEQRREELGL